MGHELINPFIEVGQGTCPKCGDLLYVLDSELSCMKVNEDGIPIGNEECIIKCEGVCPTCGTRRKMMRSGMGYKKYTRASYIWDKIELKRQRQQSIPKNTNPFAYLERKVNKE